MRRAGAVDLVPTLRSVAERGGLVQLSAVADRLDHEPTVEPGALLRGGRSGHGSAAGDGSPRMAGSRRARMGRIAEHDRIDVPVVVDRSVDAIVVRSVIDGDHLAVTVRGGDSACWLRVFGAGAPPLLLSAVPLEGNRFGTQEGSVLCYRISQRPAPRRCGARSVGGVARGRPHDRAGRSGWTRGVLGGTTLR